MDGKYPIKSAQNGYSKRDTFGMNGIDDRSECKNEYINYYPYPPGYPRPIISKLQDTLLVYLH